MSKIIQIILAPTSIAPFKLYGLDDQGVLWLYKTTGWDINSLDGSWVEVIESPEPDQPLPSSSDQWK